MSAPFADFGTCDRCGQQVSGSHYHCGGCDSLDVTSQYGHHRGFHIVDGKLRHVGFHHCAPGNCELVAAASDRPVPFVDAAPLDGFADRTHERDGLNT